MLKYIIITITLLGPMSGTAKELNPQKECFRYTYLKSSMTQSVAEKSCQKIDNPFALACSKMAIAYLYRENQQNLLDSCSKIKTEKALTCVIQKAMQARSDHAQKIQRCT